MQPCSSMCHQATTPFSNLLFVVSYESAGELVAVDALFNGMRDHRFVGKKDGAWMTDIQVDQLLEHGYVCRIDNIGDKALHDHIGQPSNIKYEKAMELDYEKRPIKPNVKN
ncbi:unnamed protein product [Ambrosiozyma monospora]|uniref:Unnamed protein product n=1 Tax=Ambrosiozyma monospora TaxID=43982 RepID=A0ACB5SQQ2_AMBMO|nr:unnamed protein product [Ambrosiozyma monospora]